jgi:iron-sulfur cluster insertion protein
MSAPINEDQTSVARFSVTPGAARQIAAIARQEGQPEAGLRVAVDAGGCSGFQYKFELETAAQPGDLVVEQDGVRVFVDEVSLDLLLGAELAWNEALIGAHFVVRNPQAVSGCGCGVSFAVA